MRVTLAEIPIRIELKVDKTEGITKYDIDNAYPQRLKRAINGSGTAKICSNRLMKFIKGKGFEDKDFGTSKVNKKSTANQLLRLNAQDLSDYRGVAIHVEYNLMLKITALTFIPFEFCRLGLPDDNGFIGDIKVYDDWARENSAKIKKDNIQTFNVYNPDPEILKAQIEKDGFEAYKGQLLYWSEEGEGNYPLSTFDAVLDDMLAEQESSAFRYENVSTKFLANYILSVDKFESSADQTESEAKQEMIESLKEFQGGRNTSKVLLLEKETGESSFDLEKVEVTKDDNLFDYTEKASTSKIRKATGIAPILIGEEISGSLGDSKEIENAYKYYNKVTTDDRIIMSEIFEELVPRFAESINTTGIYNIMPLDPDIDRVIADDEEKKEILAEILGVGSTQALIDMLSNPELSTEQKIETAKIVFGLDEDKAKALVEGAKIPADG